MGTSRLPAEVSLALLQLTAANTFLVLKIISANEMILGMVLNIPEVQHIIQRDQVEPSYKKERADTVVCAAD